MDRISNPDSAAGFPANIQHSLPFINALRLTVFFFRILKYWKSLRYPIALAADTNIVKLILLLITFKLNNSQKFYRSGVSNVTRKTSRIPTALYSFYK